MDFSLHTSGTTKSKMTVTLVSPSAKILTDTSALEREIVDAQRVALRQLYGLANDEIKIVEGK
jgi:hypothetical protein